MLGLFGSGAAVNGPLTTRVTLAAVGGVVACGIVLLAWPLLLRRIKPPARIPLAIAFAGAAGFARGLVVQAGFVLLGMADGATSAILFRAVPSIFTISFAFLVGAAGVGAIRDYRETASRLIAEQHRLISLVTASTSGLEERQSLALEEVQQRLDAELQSLDLQTPTSVAASLESLAGDVVRPLSHSLAREISAWDEEIVSEPPRIRLVDVLRRPEPSSAIRPILLPLALSVLALPGALVIYQPRNGLITSLVGLLVLGCVLTVGRQWLVKRPPQRPALVWLAVVFVLITSAVITSTVARRAEMGDASAGVIPSLALFVVPVFGIAIAVVSMVGARMESITQDLTDTTRQLQWNVARLNTAQWEQAGRLSRALHGPIQSLLHSRLLRLRELIESDGDGARDLKGDHGTPLPIQLDELRADLQRALVAALAPTSDLPVVADVLSDIAETWLGLAEITWQVGAGAESVLAQDPLCARAIADLVTEAVSNAVRHGKATLIRITVDCDGDDLIRLTVVDDGHVPQETRTGLGTRLLARCTYDWSLVPEPTTLTARLPYRTADPGYCRTPQ